MPDHIDALHKAREQMVKARRDLADGLSKPDDGRRRSLIVTWMAGLYLAWGRSSFIQVQATIEQIDKAIADEQKIGSAA